MSAIKKNILFLTVMLLSPGAKAFICTSTTSYSDINMPAVSVSADTPVGSAIGDEVVSGSVSIFNCSNTPAPSIKYQEMGVRSYGEFFSVINGRRIYKTNVPGIGYALGVNSVNNCGSGSYIDGNDTADGSADSKIVCQRSSIFTSQPVIAQAKIQLYKTGPVSGSNTVNAVQVGSFILRNNKNAWVYPEPAINTNTFSLKNPACSVSSSSVSVPMGSVEKKSFSGVGSWPGDANTRSFNILINCSTSTQVSIQMQGETQNASLGLLNITQSKSSASGVGIQILYNHAPLPLSSVINVVKANSSGLYAIPFEARYYQTAQSITPGVANANVTFSLTYQ